MWSGDETKLDHDLLHFRTRYVGLRPTCALHVVMAEPIARAAQGFEQLLVLLFGDGTLQLKKDVDAVLDLFLSTKLILDKDDQLKHRLLKSAIISKAY